MRSLLWLWILLGVAALLLLTWIVLHFRRKRIAAEEEARRRPPHEIAWESLEKLERSDLLASGHVKEFYFQLSTILRIYIEGRFQTSALEKTTTELLSTFRQIGLSSEESSLARQLLDQADLAKFAKLVPTEDEIRSDVDLLKRFLSITTPAAPEPGQKLEEAPV